ncbi:PREDICTED: torsin-4A [Gekko japonicus]|uniref:Torsin-4A n=1 Tax=Gekko japonicus TaxID=146911 RepID=A0ABM1KY00_GEKJA|nr:PREDICTED: torsin-4A [Gekko japonicus]
MLRWALFLSAYEFDLEHRPEKTRLRGAQEEVKMDSRKPGSGAAALKCPQKISLLSSPVRAIVRLRRTAHMLKKGLSPTERRTLQEDPQSKLLQRQISLGKAKLGSASASVLSQASFEKAQYFTFDTSAQPPLSRSSKRKKRSRNPRVLYPGSTRRYLPTEQKSKAKCCLLLLASIVCFQILNAIENLDDNVLKYDLDGLEKTMRREIFGQTVAIESIMALLKDYLATHIHNQPLVISFNGPSGVGKSHVGWLLAKHFRSVVGHSFVLHYFTMHHCPDDASSLACQLDLSEKISDMVTQAEIEEKIPLFILDEVELMSPALLETLSRFFLTNQTNEFLNAVYILISKVGGKEIMNFLLQNVSTDLPLPQGKMEELLTSVRPVLSHAHPFWGFVEIVPFVLLEKSHVQSCFYEEMMSEGIYPDPSHVERLASQLSYHVKGGRQFAAMGCKQVVATVNLL